MINTVTESNLKRKGSVGLYIPSHSPSLREVWVGAPGRNLEAGMNSCQGGTLLTALLPMVCSACFLLHPKTWFNHQLIRCSNLAFRPISVEVLSSQITLPQVVPEDCQRAKDLLSSGVTVAKSMS